MCQFPLHSHAQRWKIIKEKSPALVLLRAEEPDQLAKVPAGMWPGECLGPRTGCAKSRADVRSDASFTFQPTTLRQLGISKNILSIFQVQRNRRARRSSPYWVRLSWVRHGHYCSSPPDPFHRSEDRGSETGRAFLKITDQRVAEAGM